MTIKTAKAAKPQMEAAPYVDGYFDQDGNRIPQGVPVFEKALLAERGIRVIPLDNNDGFALMGGSVDHQAHETLVSALRAFGIDREAEMDAVLAEAYNAVMWVALRKAVRNV